MLRKRRRPWWTTLASLGVQGGFIALLLWLSVPTIVPGVRAPSDILHFNLAPPPAQIHHPPRPRLRAPAPRQVARMHVPKPLPAPVMPPPVPKPVSHRPEVKAEIKAPPIAKPVRTPTPRVVPKPPRPQPAPVRMGLFSTGSSARATLHRPVGSVQTGGFGAKEGVASHASGPANVPRVGAFDLPEGAGKGNGRGGAHGARGTVASIGFGDGIAQPRPAGRGSVHNVGFGDGVTSAPTPAHRGIVAASGFSDTADAAAGRPAGPRRAIVTPLQVLYKPKPQYTAEARRLHLQGTVLLQAVFRSTGQVHILRVVRGLGHGLDQSAMAAAREIRFTPEKRDGKPVDTTATLAIVFQLAY